MIIKFHEFTNIFIFLQFRNFITNHWIAPSQHIFFCNRILKWKKWKEILHPFLETFEEAYLSKHIMIKIINTISSSISWWSAKKRFKNRMLKNYQKLEFNLGHLGTGGKLYFHEYLQKKSKNSNPSRFKHFLCFPPPL